MATYRKINPIEMADGNHLNELKLSVNYHKGHGIYVGVTPVRRENRGNGFLSEQSVLLGQQRESGMYLFAKKVTRKSQKTEDAIATALERKADDIAALYNEEKYNEIKEIVTQCA